MVKRNNPRRVRGVSAEGGKVKRVKQAGLSRK